MKAIFHTVRAGDLRVPPGLEDAFVYVNGQGIRIIEEARLKKLEPDERCVIHVFNTDGRMHKARLVAVVGRHVLPE